MMQHLRTSAMIAAFVLGYLCPWASALNGLIRWLIVIMMFLVFLQVRVSWRTLRLGHLNILLANIGIGMGSWFLCRIFGSSELAMAAFFTGITPTATAAAVIVHLLGGRVEYAVSAFLTTNLGMALLLPFLIPVAIGNPAPFLRTSSGVCSSSSEFRWRRRFRSGSSVKKRRSCRKNSRISHSSSGSERSS